MARSTIAEGRSIEDAVQKGCAELGVPPDKVEVEIIRQPSGRLAQLVGAKTIVKVTTSETPSDTTEEADNVIPQDKPANGLVWVKDGKLGYSAPKNGGGVPTVIIDPKLTVYYQGQPVKGRLELVHGIDDISIELPRSIQAKKNVQVQVSEDRLQAFLDGKREPGISYFLAEQKPAPLIQLQLMAKNISPPEISSNELSEAVREANVCFGLDLSKVDDKLLAQRDFYVVIATGKEPIPPVAARIEYEFEKRNQPKIDLESLRVDHFEVRGVMSVDAGELIARKIPGKNGEDGIDVLGKKIPGLPYKDTEIRAGDGVRVSEDGLEAFAETEGLPVVQNGVLKVIKVLELPSDADVSTGHIRFKGEIIIRGSVRENIQVEAQTGGVHVFGLVTGAEIQSDGSVIIEKNAVSSTVRAGGMTVVYLKLLSYLHTILDQTQRLLNGFYLVSHQAQTNDSKLFKHLLELKFSSVPKTIEELVEYANSLGAQIEPEFHRTVARLAGAFLGRGPLEITNIGEVEQIVERLAEWEAEFCERSQLEASIEVKYLHNCRLEASGLITVTGQGSYNSQVIAGKGFVMERGFFRGGEILVDEGEIVTKELGGPTGVATNVKIVHEGKITASKVYPNVSVTINNQKFKFQNETQSIKAFWAEERLRVYSGSIELT